MSEIAKHTKADIFLVYRKPTDDQASAEGEPEDNRPRFVIYGDAVTEEHARIRTLVMIDKLVWHYPQNFHALASRLLLDIGS
jgi:hypothetical protein